jgi:hypothetical protein
MPASRERVSAGHSAAFIDRAECAGSQLEEFDQLRGRAAEQNSRILGIVIASGQNVESFSQQCRKVIVFRVHINSTAATTGTPKRARRIRIVGVVTDRTANRQCQLKSEPMHCHPAVFPLSSPFGGLGNRSGRAVRQYYRRLDLVSVLAPWSRAPRGAKITLAGQLIGVERGRMIG